MGRTRSPQRKQGTIDNLRQVYLSATKDDKQDGLCWYEVAQLTIEGISCTCETISKRAYIHTTAVAAIVAVLSPQMRWEQNITLADNVIQYYMTGGNYEDFRHNSGAFQENVKKAFDILEGRLLPLDIKGNKVVEFRNALLGDTKAVVVDSWIRRAWLGEKEWGKLLPSEYKTIAASIHYLAVEYGTTPREMQAIIWVTLRNRGTYHGV